MTGFGAQATDAAGNTSELTPSGCTSTNMGSCSWNDHVITIDRTKPNTVLYVYKLNSDGSKGDLISGPIYNNGYDNLNTVNHKYYFEIYRYDTGFSQIAYSNGFGFRTSVGRVFDTWNVPDDPNYNKWYSGSKIDETLETPGNRIAYVTALNNLEGKRELRIRVSIADSAPDVQDVDHTSGNNNSTVGNKCSNGPDCSKIYDGTSNPSSICGSRGFIYANDNMCKVAENGATCQKYGGSYSTNTSAGITDRCQSSSSYRPYNLSDWTNYSDPGTTAESNRNCGPSSGKKYYKNYSRCTDAPSQLWWASNKTNVNFQVNGAFFCCK